MGAGMFRGLASSSRKFVNELIANYMTKQNLDKLFHVLGSLEICFRDLLFSSQMKQPCPTHGFEKETQLGGGDRQETETAPRPALLGCIMPGPRASSVFETDVSFILIQFRTAS